MSMDSVDDLEHAEDLIGEAIARGCLTDDYCRPTCQANGPRADCESEDPETCGCLCHNKDDT